MKILKNSKRIYQNMDKPLLWTSLLLLVIGLAMILSASSPVALMYYDRTNIFGDFIAQFVFIVVSLSFVYLTISRIPIRKLVKLATALTWLMVIVLIIVYFFGDTINNAKSWLPIPFTNRSVQPSEFAKPIIILYIAAIN